MLTSWHGQDTVTPESGRSRWPVTPSQPSLAPSCPITGQYSVHVICVDQSQPSIGGSRGWNLRSLHNYSLKTARAILLRPDFWGSFQVYPLKYKTWPSWWICSARPVVCVFLSHLFWQSRQVSYHLRCQQRDLIFTSFTIFWTNSWPGWTVCPIMSVLKLPKIVKTNPASQDSNKLLIKCVLLPIWGFISMSDVRCFWSMAQRL